jgi:DNA ligase (NAD+)
VPEARHHRIEKWVGVLDVRDLGVGLIKRLFDSGRVRSIPDLYTLTVDELASLDRMGETSAAKVLKSLRSRSEVSLEQFVAGFDIEGIGETMVEKLVGAGYATLDSLLAAGEDEIAGVYQFGETMARALRLGLDRFAPRWRPARLGRRQDTPPGRQRPPRRVSFCFTGELASMKRPEAEARVKPSAARRSPRS